MNDAAFVGSIKWATEPNVSVENVSISDGKIGTNYLELGRQMLRNYEGASAGIIDVRTVTRRDVYTGLLVPLAEGDR
jgi:hypothetical protein